MQNPLRLLLCASPGHVDPRRGADRRISSLGAQVVVSVTAPIAPPLLPVYAQPPIPAVGYAWIPGYWAWNGQEYYWVPGYGRCRRRRPFVDGPLLGLE